MKYNVVIEGQKIPMPEEIGKDDGKIKAALAPYFPGAANSKIMRGDPVEDTVEITVIKVAGNKGGSGTGAGNKGGSGLRLERVHELLQNLETVPAGEDTVLEKLEAAPEGINAAIQLYEELDLKVEEKKRKINKMKIEDRLLLDDKIAAAIQEGRGEERAISSSLVSLTGAEPQPLSFVYEGF